MPNPELLELEIEGMTCTACARRVEKNLNQVPGVSAYVDFATEKAHLQFKGEYQLEELKKAVESAGYKVGDGKPELLTLRPRLIATQRCHHGHPGLLGFLSGLLLQCLFGALRRYALLL